MPRRGKDGDGVAQKPAGSGIYYARWKDVNGADHVQSFGKGEKNRADAQRHVYKMRELAQDMVRHPERYEPPAPPPERWTLKQAIEDYQANSRASTDSKSHSTDWTHGRALIALWGSRAIDSIKPVEVQDWMTRRTRAKKKANTVNRERGFLKRVCRRAIACGKASTDPTEGAKPMKAGRTVPRYLLPNEVPRLQEQLTGRDWLAVELAYRTGLRQAEQFSLKKEQVNLHARQLVLLDPKSKEQEVVPLNSRAVEVLRELMDTTSPWVFPASRGDGPMSVTWFLKHVFRPALERAKIPNFHWHCLRHTTASWLAIAGVDLGRIQKIMRHRSYAMTLVYAHLQPDHLTDAVEVIAGDAPTGRTHRIGTETEAKSDPEPRL